MRSRVLILLSVLLILVLAVPAAAGDQNDNGNGMRTVYVETLTSPALLSMPVCQDGAEVGDLDFLSHKDTVITRSEKADGSRIAWRTVSSNVADEAAFRTESRSHHFINSIDEDPTGFVTNQNSVMTWSDPDGVYATTTPAGRRAIASASVTALSSTRSRLSDGCPFCGFVSALCRQLTQPLGYRSRQ